MWYYRDMKTAKQMQRHFKGMANHHRINILLLVDAHPGVALEQIVESLEANFKTISQHTRALVQSGLMDKQYRGRMVEHRLSPYGKRCAQFIKEFRRLGTK